MNYIDHDLYEYVLALEKRIEALENALKKAIEEEQNGSHLEHKRSERTGFEHKR